MQKWTVSGGFSPKTKSLKRYFVIRYNREGGYETYGIDNRMTLDKAVELATFLNDQETLKMGAA